MVRVLKLATVMYLLVVYRRSSGCGCAVRLRVNNVVDVDGVVDVSDAPIDRRSSRRVRATD